MTAASNRNAFITLSAVLLLSLAATALFNNALFLLVPAAALLLYAGWADTRFLFLLLICSLPFSFEYNFTDSLGTDIPDEALMLLVSFVFLGFWLYTPASIEKQTWRHPLLVLLFIHMAWIGVTTISSGSPLLSVKFLLAKSWYLGAFVLAPLILFRNKPNIRLTAACFAIAMLLVAVIAVIRHAEYGFSFATVNRSLGPFFRNHVNYSSMLVCAIPLFFAFRHLAKRKLNRSVYGIVIIILVFALFLSFARGAWLALLLGAVAYLLIKHRLLVISFSLAIVIAVASLFWLKSSDRYLLYAHDFQTTIYHEDFKQHLVATYQLKDVSTAERFYRWIAGVRMIKDKWLTGYGPGTFYDNYKPYGVPAYKTWVSDNKEKSTVHNYFLLLAIEQGLPGLIFFLLLLAVMLYYTQCLYHRIQDPFYKTGAAVSGVIVVMIATVNFLSDLIETDKVGSLFFLCLTALVMIDRNTRKKSEPAPDIQRIS